MPYVRSETTAFTRGGMLFLEPPERWRKWQRDIWSCGEGNPICQALLYGTPEGAQLTGLLPPATPGQRAYEADCAAKPRYQDGGLRKTWAALSPIARETWERNPTPRW